MELEDISGKFAEIDKYFFGTAEPSLLGGFKCWLGKHDWRVYREAYIIEKPPIEAIYERELAIWKRCKRCGELGTLLRSTIEKHYTIDHLKEFVHSHFPEYHGKVCRVVYEYKYKGHLQGGVVIERGEI